MPARRVTLDFELSVDATQLLRWTNAYRLETPAEEGVGNDVRIEQAPEPEAAGRRSWFGADELSRLVSDAGAAVLDVGRRLLLCHDALGNG